LAFLGIWDLKKRISESDDEENYHLNLKPFHLQDEKYEVKVSERLYQSTEIGDSVSVWMYSGFLGFHTIILTRLIIQSTCLFENITL
jgi:hypothetical protein